MNAPIPRQGTKGERTRSRILDSAMELFSRSGFYAVSLRDIAAHAGMTHAGLLHHFPGKDDLLIQVLARREQVAAEQALSSDSDLAPEELLSRHLDQITLNMGTPGLVGLFVKVSGEASDPAHPAHDYFVQRYRRLRKRTAWLMSVLFDRATPPIKHDPDAVAQQLLALVDGLQTQWLLDPEQVDMRASVVAFLTQLGLELEPDDRPHP
ncbi:MULTISPECIES: TetR/AcrR family transcriptional regulator [Nonomuraea]|uniref:AcrR family transcriptional regulator n=3 Tax=Nonomuraea TaxID=83681 RepID=A0A7W5V3B4_9ACTN|nr:TetR/AcrR family transcriptional regulator [Nonomuraea dietziae]MBB3724225.1 AcrR family transcriptional regulator [Nonomuraea dietziae]